MNYLQSKSYEMKHIWSILNRLDIYSLNFYLVEFFYLFIQFFSLYKIEINIVFLYSTWLLFYLTFIYKKKKNK